jgi:hypothetical protein
MTEVLLTDIADTTIPRIIAPTPKYHSEWMKHHAMIAIPESLDRNPSTFTNIFVFCKTGSEPEEREIIVAARDPINEADTPRIIAATSMIILIVVRR